MRAWEWRNRIAYITNQASQQPSSPSIVYQMKFILTEGGSSIYGITPFELDVRFPAIFPELPRLDESDLVGIGCAKSAASSDAA